MTPETIEEGVICLGILCIYLVVLAAGCLIADFVLPHIRPIEKYLEGLPEFDDDEELARRYEKINWKRVGRQVQENAPKKCSPPEEAHQGHCQEIFMSKRYRLATNVSHETRGEGTSENRR